MRVWERGVGETRGLRDRSLRRGRRRSTIGAGSGGRSPSTSPAARRPSSCEPTDRSTLGGPSVHIAACRVRG